MNLISLNELNCILANTQKEKDLHTENKKLALLESNVKRGNRTNKKELRNVTKRCVYRRNYKKIRER